MPVPESGARWAAGRWAALLAALGIPVGLLWFTVAPRAEWVVRDAGGQFKDANTQAIVAADGWFFVITLAVGVACGVAAFASVRRHGPIIAAAVAVGGLVGAAIAAGLGHWLSLAPFAADAAGAADGDVISYLLTMRSLPFLGVWPFAAELTLVVFTYLSWPRAQDDAAVEQPQLAPQVP